MLVNDDLRHDGLLRSQALDGFSEELARHLVSADKKFANYEDYRCLLAVQFFGESRLDVYEEDLIDLIGKAELPDSIDEVWIAYHDWIDAYNHEVAWKCVRTRGE